MISRGLLVVSPGGLLVVSCCPGGCGDPRHRGRSMAMVLFHSLEVYIGTKRNIASSNVCVYVYIYIYCVCL